MLTFILTMALAAPPRVAQWTQDIRQSSGAWFAGDGLSGATIRYAAPMTVTYTGSTPTNLAAEVSKAIDAWSEHPVIDWSTTGQDAETTSTIDKVCRAFLTIDQGVNGGANNKSYCFAFVARNKDGLSDTWVANRPTIYGLAGSEPTRLGTGTLHDVRGRHLCAEFVDPTLWLWDGIDSKKLIQVPVLEPGGRGTGRVKQQKECSLFFEIPAAVPAGNYFLVASTSENQLGISDPKGCPVTVTGKTDPTITEGGVSLTAASGTDITPWLIDVIAKAKPSDDAPLVIRLPAGVFYVSKVIEVPANVFLVGAGKFATTITPLPSLTTSFATSAQTLFGRSGMFYVKGRSGFRDLTLDLSPDDRRQTVRHLVIVGPGVDGCSFRSVRFRNILSQSNSAGYCDGVIYRYGLQRYWRFVDCDWECQVAFEGRLDSTAPFSSNGAFDRALFYGGSFRSVHGLSSASLFGSGFGRGCLIYGMDVSHTRRGFSFSSLDACMESAIVACHFHDMKSEQNNGETIVHESKRGFPATCKASTLTSFTIDGDTKDRARWTAIILSGTGQYQYRVIRSSVAGFHTIETPWAIPPDATSQLLLVQCPTDCSYVWNRFEQTFGGINFYGSAVGNIVAGNLMTGSDEGVLLSTNADSAGEGIAVHYWLSATENWFDGGAGYHLIAPRATADFKTLSSPQIACINLSWNQYLGDVVNQLWAGEGTEQSADENGPNLRVSPTIDCISDYYSKSIAVPHYLHRPLTSSAAKTVWVTTQAGIGTFDLRGMQVNGKVIDQVPLVNVISR